MATPRAAWARSISWDANQRKRLDHGEILVRTTRLGNNTGRAEASGVVAAKPAEVFAVIADVAHYKDFMTRMVSSKIVGRTGETYLFSYELDMPWPLADHRCVTRNTHRIDVKRQRYERRWSLVSGTFIRNEGYWRVRPWSKGRSLISYAAVVQPKTAAPDFLVNYVAKKALPRALAALRKRVEKLAGRPSQ